MPCEAVIGPPDTEDPLMRVLADPNGVQVFLAGLFSHPGGLIDAILLRIGDASGIVNYCYEKAGSTVTTRNLLEALGDSLPQNLTLSQQQSAHNALILAAAGDSSITPQLAADHIRIWLQKAGYRAQSKSKIATEIDSIRGESAATSPFDLAGRYLDSLRGRGSEESSTNPASMPYLLYFRGGFFRFREAMWRPVTTQELSADVCSFLATIGEGHLIVKRMIEDIVVNLQGQCVVPDTGCSPPFLIEGEARSPRAVPWIRLQNGVLDLERAMAADERALIAENHAYFDPVRLDFGFDPNVDCPMFSGVLDKILPRKAGGEADNRQLVLQELFGYCLMRGDLRLHKFFVLVGEGASGKSTMLKMLIRMLGAENVSSVPLHQLKGRFALAPIEGKLANVVAECSKSPGADEELLKMLASGDSVQIERKHQPPYSTTLVAKQVFATNQLPCFSDNSEGLWRRILVIPFLDPVPQEEQDPSLLDQLASEMPGVLNWALAGARRLQEKGGFTRCSLCDAAAAEHRHDSNPVAQFAQEHLREAPGRMESPVAVYKAYTGFCRSRGFTPTNVSAFGRTLKTVIPYSRVRKTINRLRKWVYEGILLNSISSESP